MDREDFRKQLAELCDTYERASGSTVGLHLLELEDDGSRHDFDWNGESMYPAVASDMPRIEIAQDLCFSMLETLRLAHVYALLGSEIQSELGDDFKPWKWSTESVREFAHSASHQHTQLMTQMTGQVRPPTEKGGADEERDTGVPPDRSA